MKHVGWHFDVQEPKIAAFWNGQQFTHTKLLEEVGLEPLYDAYTGEVILNYDRPEGAVQHYQDWKKNELRHAATVDAERQALGLPASRRKGKGIGCFGVVLLITLCSWAFNSFAPDVGSSADAESACQEFIKERIKSPSSAAFSDVRTVQQDNVYKVTSVVEADNAFGSRVSNRWTCRVVWKTADKKFSLDLLEHN